MPTQDVRDLVPRVRRALEGPVPLASGALSEDQVEAVAADAIADLILLTAGEWPHTLAVSGTDADTGAVSYTVDPGLSLPEQSLVAAQAALTYILHTIRDMKSSETIRNEGQEWNYTTSANLLRDHLKLLQAQRDAALESLSRANPIMVRVSSILAVRDRLASAVIEPWLNAGLGGGYELTP